MDLTYSAEDLAFRARTRRWLEENAPRHELRTLEARTEWHRRLYRAGYVGMGRPRAHGGRDASLVQQAIVVDEAARVNALPPVNDLGVGIVGPTLLIHGTESQKLRYLKKDPHCRRNLVSALYSEPNAGSSRLIACGVAE